MQQMPLATFVFASPHAHTCAVVAPTSGPSWRQTLLPASLLACVLRSAAGARHLLPYYKAT
eukprot:1564577-Amphidinium_carterae.1